MKYVYHLYHSAEFRFVRNTLILLFYLFCLLIAGISVANAQAPVIVSSTPSNGDTDVLVGSDIVITFDKTVQFVGGNSIELQSASGNVSTSTLIVSGTILRISPTSTLNASTVYTVNIPGGILEDLFDNPFPGSSSISFTTSSASSTDNVAPTVSSYSPGNNSGNNSLTGNIVITFSENIRVADNNAIRLRRNDNNFLPWIGTENTVSGTTVTLNPDYNLVNGAQYFVTIDRDAITDLAGNPFAGLLTPTDYRFTTVVGVPSDASGPSPTSFDPIDDAVVSVDATVDITFSENIFFSSPDGRDQHVQLRRLTDNVEVPSEKTISGSTLTFTPNEDLDHNTFYYVWITSNGALSGLKDLAGNSSSAINSSTYRFSTGSANNPPTDISLTETSFEENQSDPTEGLTLIATTDDPGDTHTYSLVAGNGVDDADNDDFEIAGNLLRSKAAFDYETQDTYRIRIQTEDQDGATYSEAFTITVIDIADETAPMVTSRVPEDGAFGVSLTADFSITFDESVSFENDENTVQLWNATAGTLVQSMGFSQISPSTGTTIGINPTANLLPNTDYYITISSESAFVDGSDNAFEGLEDPTDWNFSTSSAATPPQVTNLSPSDGFTNLNTFLQIFTASFDAPIQFGPNRNQISVISTSGAPSFNNIGSLATIDNTGVPDGTNRNLRVNLPARTETGSSYYIIIPDNAIQGLDGTAFPGITGTDEWNFSTTDFVITGSDPADGATDVDVNATFTITFDRNVSSRNFSRTISIKRVSNDQIVAGFNTFPVNSQVVFSNNTISFTASNLPELEDLYIDIPNNAVYDATTLLPFQGTSTDEIVFTTISTDTDPPGLFTGANNLTPEDDASGVDVSSDLFLVFDEEVVITNTSGIELKTKMGDQLVATTNSIAANGVTLQIVPTMDLERGVDYYVSISSDAITDLVGNPYPGFTDNESWDFTTELPVPEIVSFTPTASDLAPGGIEFVITYNKPVAFAPTFNGQFGVFESGGSRRAFFDITSNRGDVEIDGAVVTFRPSVLLASDLDHYVTMAEGVFVDASNTSLLAEGILTTSEWTFRTRANDGNGPGVVTFTPAAGANRVGNKLNEIDFTITFDEPVYLGNTNDAILIYQETGATDNLLFDLGNNQASLSADNLTVILNVTVNRTLTLGAEYYITIDETNFTGPVIYDADGNTYSISDENTWKFRIHESPQLTFISPVDDATEVPLDATMTFEVDNGLSGTNTGNIFLRRYSNFGEVARVAPGEAVVNGNQVTLDFGMLLPGFDYYVDIPFNSIQDAFGNGFSTFNRDAWNFSTEKADQTISFPPINDKVFTDPDFDLMATSSSGLPISYMSSNTNVATVSGNTVTIVGAGTTTITASQPGSTSFNPASDVQQSFSVSKADQMISFSTSGTRTYGGSNFTLSATSTSGLPITFSSSDSDVIDITGNAASIVGAGSVTLTASQVGDANFNAAVSVDQLVDVQKASLNAIADDKTRVFGQANPILTISYTGFVGVDNVNDLDVEPNASTNATAMSDVGTYPITVSGGSDDDYSYNFIDGDLRITQASQSIIFDPIADKTFGDAPFTVNATASSGLPVSFTIINGPATISNNEVTITGAGTVIVGAQQNGNINYNAASATNQSFTVAKADQTISIVPIPDKLITDDPFDVTATSSSGLPVTINVSSGPASSVGNTVTLDGISGTVVLNVFQTGNANFNSIFTTTSFAVNNPTLLNQTITFDAIPTKTFGDAPFSIAATSSSGLDVTFSVVSGPITLDDNEVTITGAGTAEIRADQSGDATYNPAPSVTQTLTIDKADQSITFDAIADKTFGDAPFILSATASSNLQVEFSVVSGPVDIDDDLVTITGAGTVVIAANQAGDDDFNAASEVTQTFIINKAEQTITIDAISDKLTTDAAFDVVATTTSNLALDYSVTGPATNNGPTITLTGTAGTVTVTVAQAGNDNYNEAAATESFEVSDPAKQDQTITFDAIPDKVFGDTSFTLSATATSSLPVDFSVVSGPIDLDDNLVTITGAGTAVIAANQAGDDDFNAASEVTQTFTINKADQSITFDAIADKTFGDAPFPLSATASSSLPVDFSVVSGPIDLDDDLVTITGAGTAVIAANQAGDDDFNAASEVTQTFTINKADQTITIDAISDKLITDAAFDVVATTTSNLALNYSVSGPATNDGPTITLTGTAGTVTVTVAQAGNENYNEASASVSFLVTDPQKSDQSITFDDIPDKVFGDASFTLSATATSNLTVSFSVVSGPITLDGNEVTITGAGTAEIAANQAGDENFNPAVEVTRSFSISKADQAITISPISDKLTTDAAFDVVASTTSNLALEYSVSGPATNSGPTITLDGTVGTVTVTVAQAGNDNYNAATAVETFEVTAPTKADQTITFEAIADKTFGDQPFAITAIASSSLAVEFSVISGPITLVGDEVTITGAGVAEIAANQAGDDDFNAAPEVTQTFSIGKADQVITIDPIADKVTNDDPFDIVASTTSALELAFTITGPATISGTTITLDGAAGTVTVTATQAGNDNFNAATTSESFEVTESNVLSVHGLDPIHIYPNPTTRSIYFSGDQYQVLDWVIVGPNGAIVRRGNSVSEGIDLIDLNDGIYHLQLNTTEGKRSLRVIKK